MDNLCYISLDSLPAVPDAVLECIYDAWRPAVDMLFDKREALEAIGKLMDKDKSELARKNIHVILHGADLAGVTVGINMFLLKAARQTNLFCLTAAAKDSASFLQRLKKYGECFARFEGEGTYLSKFAVVPEYRGKGFGDKLMQCFIDAERIKKTSTIYLEVYQENRAAISLYKKSSFTETAAEPATSMYKIMVKKIEREDLRGQANEKTGEGPTAA